jgi:para-nitrobenzyl esterase
MSSKAVTEFGTVEGEARGSHVAFRGIPFAAPPVGRLRFRPPEPPPAWTGIRDTRAFAPAAMQGLSFAPGASADGPQSEDCLYLNVYTPGVDAKKRPVMVFIHGGAFIVGSSSMPLYDGGRLAALGDVVVVTTNYRLGAFGYLCLGDEGSKWGATPNVGALDQVAALGWVRRNIERFGGDPNSVTVFGESAGGTSVLLLLAMPAASGLFHRAIAQSPGNAIGIPDPAPGLDVSAQLLSALGIPKRDSEKLRDVAPEAIIKAQNTVKSPLWVGFFPVLDSETIPIRPQDLFADGRGARVPVLVGTNRDEWNLFELPKSATAQATNPDALVAAILERGFPKNARERIPALAAAYRMSRSDRGLPSDDGAVIRAVAGDIRFRIPSIRFAEAHEKRGLSTYMYLFTHGSPAMRGILGACHALDLPFVFGTLDAPLQDRFAGAGPDIEALSTAMMRSWIAFAKTGNPNDGATVEWPLYDAHRRATLVFDKTIRVEDAPLDEERAVWDGIV